MGIGIGSGTQHRGGLGTVICALLCGEARSAEEADHVAKLYSSCPHVYLMATRDRQLFATFLLPKRQRWWIEHVEKNPEETFGLKRTRVTFVSHVEYPGQLEMRRPKKTQTVAPRGSNCGKCSSYEKCLGCPATVFHKQAGDRSSGSC
jgi:hypothetical protein